MTDLITELVESAGYLGVCLLMLLETVFPPIPSEIIMTLAGLQAVRGDMSLAGVIAAGTLGAMLGNIFWYVVARWFGHHGFEPFVRRWGRWLTMTQGDVARAHRWFDRHGGPFVLFGRVIPTLRSLVSIPAGLMEMKFGPFVVYSTIGTAAWTAALALVGAKLGENYAVVEAYIGPVSIAVVAAIVLGFAYRVATWKPH